MIVSLNWLKQYTDINLSIDELTILIGERLVEIEGVEYIGDKYKDVIVARVVTCAPLEGTDHLSLTTIDDGGVRQGVDRNDDGYVQVVCGAPNVEAGILVAWLPPESVVPETYGDKEPFVLGAKQLRGVVSNGMLASAKELDLYDDHTGILIIDKNAKPGDSFRDLYELDDYLLDIENKSLTHRPDAFGVIGFAREVAGIQGLPFSNPDWLQLDRKLEGVEGESLQVAIDDPTLSDRFQAVLLTDINENALSPIQMQTYLSRSGIRPINAAVDAANFVMLLTGQPSHTYDYDKLLAVSGGSGVVHVRTARTDETLELLDGKVIELDESDIVIAAGDVAVGLAGIMGGATTAVDETTKRVLLEVATFDLYHLRTSQMRHGIFSEAVTRFTKGIPAPLGGPALAEVVRLLQENAGAKVASFVADDYPGERRPGVVTVTEDLVNSVLGVQLSAEDIVTILENVGFDVAFSHLTATVTVPYWREDIHIAEDIVEEVGRMVGFDTINLTLPSRNTKAVEPSGFDTFRSKLRQYLVRAGANEVLTYSFVHEDSLKKAGQNPENSYRIVNSLSPELQRYRQSLTPSLLPLVHANKKAGYDNFALFEINKTHDIASGLTDENVPVEHSRVAFVIAPNGDSTAYYVAKKYVDYIAEMLGVSVDFRPLEKVGDDPVVAPFEPKRSAALFDNRSGAYLGIVGEYRKAVASAWKLPESVAGFELNLQALFRASAARSSDYRPLSKYPGTERDVCFRVGSEVPYREILSETKKILEKTHLITSIEPVDIYRAEGAETKNVTIRIRLGSYDKTLTSDEVAAVMGEVESGVTGATKGEVV